MALVEVDRKTVDVATVQAAPSAQGSIANYFYWNLATNGYQAQPPTISVGQELGVMSGVVNNSGYSENMRLDMVFTDPQGQQQTLTGQVKTVAAGAAESWSGRLQSSKVGVYKVALVLYAEVAA